MIHRPQKHLTGRRMFIKFLMQEIAFFQHMAVTQGTPYVYKEFCDEILWKTGNLETLSVPVVRLSITSPETNQLSRTREAEFNAQREK